MISLAKFKNFMIKSDAYFNPPLSNQIDYDAYNQKLYKNATILFNKQNNEITGVLAGYVNDTNSRCAYVFFIAVDKNHRGGGQGRKLIEKFIRRCRAKNFNSIKLETCVDNPAQIMYVKLGFKEYARNDKTIQFILNLEG